MNNNKPTAKSSQSTISVTDDLRVSIELHFDPPLLAGAANVVLYLTEEGAWDHRSALYEALKAIRDERHRRGMHAETFALGQEREINRREPLGSLHVTPEQLLNDQTYETMTPVATPEGVAFVPVRDVPPLPREIPAFTHARVTDLRDEKLVELGAWREAARALGFKSPADMTAVVGAIRAMVDDERKATVKDRARLDKLETLLVKAIAWRDWDGTAPRFGHLGVRDPQDDLEACINAIAPVED